MRPVVTPRTDVILRGGPGVGDLPATRCDPACTMSVWDLSPDERIAIAEGALIELHVQTFTPHPPVELRISTESRPLPPIRRVARGDV